MAAGRSGQKIPDYTENLDILAVKEVYTYTIPSFSAVTVRLRHVVVKNYDESIGQQRNVSKTLDVFFCEDEGLTSLKPPVRVKVIRACCIPVSICESLSIKLFISSRGHCVSTIRLKQNQMT